jgi:hypothetical protein
MKRLGELTINEIRDRVGHEPTIPEWILLAHAAAAERDFAESMQKLDELFQSDEPFNVVWDPSEIRKIGE